MGRSPVVTAERVRASLQEVLDPHMKISVVDMGMVRSIDVAEGGEVSVGVSFPCIGCPAWTMIQEDMRDAIASLDGVSKVSVKVNWDTLWCKDDLAPEARTRIRTFGYQIHPME